MKIDTYPLAVFGLLSVIPGVVLASPADELNLQKAALLQRDADQGLFAPHLINRLQSGNVALIPDDKRTRGLILAMYQTFNDRCPPIDGQPRGIAMRAVEYMNPGSSGGVLGLSKDYSQPVQEGAADASKLLGQFGCKSGKILGLRKGINAVLQDSQTTPDEVAPSFFASLLSDAARKNLGLNNLIPAKPASTSHVMVCWRQEINRETGVYFIDESLRKYYGQARSTTVDAAIKGASSAARQIIQAGLYPVLYVNFPELSAYRLGLTVQGESSLQLQKCRFSGYEQERIPL